MRQLLPTAVAEQVCVDGKTLRGSDLRPLHLVSTLARAEGLRLALVAGADKGHELAALPNVLTLLDLSGGALVSLDALGCQPHVAAQTVEQGGDYLLAFKQNQRGLRAESERTLAGVALGHEVWGWAAGNLSVRWLVAVPADLRWVDKAGRWPAWCGTKPYAARPRARRRPRPCAITSVAGRG